MIIMTHTRHILGLAGCLLDFIVHQHALHAECNIGFTISPSAQCLNDCTIIRHFHHLVGTSLWFSRATKDLQNSMRMGL